MTQNNDYNQFAGEADLIRRAEILARGFIKDDTQFHLGFIPTEQSHPYSRNLSTETGRDTREGLKTILNVDRDLPSVARRVMLGAPFAALVEAFELSAREKRRVCFTGCGSTGRLSMILEEMWRQFWEDRADVAPGDAVLEGKAGDDNLECADLACSIMTGGDRALIRAVENFEDYEAFGARQVEELDLGEGDLLVAISEGGETSSVIGTVEEARRRKCRVFFVFNNPAELLKERLERCQRVIDAEDVTVLDLYTGPMALSGSTRMQATTMEMLVVGAAMETALLKFMGEELPSAGSYAETFSLMLEELSRGRALEGMAAWTDLEEKIYRRDGLVTYLAERYLLDIFSDTTERSPTFMLPPFRPSDDEKSPISWAFAKDPKHEGPEAWLRMLRRYPRGLDWSRQDYLDMGAPEYSDNVPQLDQREIARYMIGREEDQSRMASDEWVFLNILVDKDGKAEKPSDEKYKNLFIGSCGETAEGDIAVPLTLSDSPVFLWHHLAVKLILNTMSTATMAGMGRISGNWMIQLDPTNKKLVDRACRIISQLVGISYEKACQELYISLLARQRLLEEGGQTILSPVVATLTRLRKEF